MVPTQHRRDQARKNNRSAIPETTQLMSRRRVFRTKVECHTLSPAIKRKLIIGQPAILRKTASGTCIDVVLGQTVVGRLDDPIGNQIAAAIDRGQSFSASIENAYELSNRQKVIHLKVEYVLETGQPAIDVPKPGPMPERKGEWKTFYTRVAGVTFLNADYSDRQSIIRKCSEGERVHLVREPSNPHDPFAVMVIREDGQQLGYLPDHVAGDDTGIGWCVARGIDQGRNYTAVIKDLTGGGDKTHGVNIQVSYWDGPGTPEPRNIEPSRAVGSAISAPSPLQPSSALLPAPRISVESTQTTSPENSGCSLIWFAVVAFVLSLAYFSC